MGGSGPDPRASPQILAQRGPTEGRRCWEVTAGSLPAQVRWVWQSPLTLTFWVSRTDHPATLSPGSSLLWALPASDPGESGALNSEQPPPPKPSGGPCALKASRRVLGDCSPKMASPGGRRPAASTGLSLSAHPPMAASRGSLPWPGGPGAQASLPVDQWRVSTQAHVHCL